MQLQPAQAHFRAHVSVPLLDRLEELPTVTVIHGGQIIFCGGLVPRDKDTALLWGFVSADAKQCFVALHRAAYRFMDGAGYARIECAVDIEFNHGHRWAKLLGFELDNPRVEGYRPDGGASALYARVAA